MLRRHTTHVSSKNFHIYTVRKTFSSTIKYTCEGNSFGEIVCALQILHRCLLLRIQCIMLPALTSTVIHVVSFSWTVPTRKPKHSTIFCSLFSINLNTLTKISFKLRNVMLVGVENFRTNYKAMLWNSNLVVGEWNHLHFRHE